MKSKFDNKVTMEQLVNERGGVTRKEIMEAVKTWIGTPYVHRQRLKGHAADCIQFLIGVAEDLNIFPSWIDKEIGTTQYSTSWHLHQNQELLIEHVELLGLIEKPIATRIPGDVVGFKFGKATAHLGVIMPNEILVHAQHAPPCRVMETKLTRAWTKRITKAWKIPGIIEG